MTDNEIIKFIEHAINSAKGENGVKEIYWEKLDYILDFINRQKAEIERLQKNIDGLNIFTKNHIKVIKLQAMKEITEELKRKATVVHKTHSGKHWYEIDDDEIDNIIKEIIEEGGD